MSGKADLAAALLAKARSYVAASNDADLARIEVMLLPTCVYQSSGVGDHQGAVAIMAMMAGFFTANPDVHWRATNYRLAEPDCVEFDFVISLQNSEAPGVERLCFDEDRLIRQIEVRR